MNRKIAAAVRARQRERTRNEDAASFTVVHAPARLRALATAKVRERIARRIERHLDAASALIALLDTDDGDPDFEPWLGAREGRDGSRWGTPDGHTNDDREADDDFEPSLDSRNSYGYDFEVGHVPPVSE